MNKPNDLISSLGPDVEMNTKTLEKDVWANTMLNEIGRVVTKQQQAEGMRYLGSFAVHIIAHDALGISGKMDMGSITQISIGDECSEKLMVLALSNATLQLRRYFNPGAKASNRLDKR